uniref:Uncharacterized protein n=1 Tax=Anguilla anguilla TaxID=7936 RepID=A0A0E9XXX6_ANGAN
MQHTFQFYSSIFAKKKCYFYSVIFGYIPLVTFIFYPFFIQRTFCLFLSLRETSAKEADWSLLWRCHSPT